jgi:hypothetical protein
MRKKGIGMLNLKSSLEYLFNDGLIRSTYKRRMTEAYEKFVKCKKDYYTLIGKREKLKWNRLQKERLEDGL